MKKPTSGFRTDKYEQEWNGFWQFFNVMQFNKSFAAVCRTGLDSHAYVTLPHGLTQFLQSLYLVGYQN